MGSNPTSGKQFLFVEKTLKSNSRGYKGKKIYSLAIMSHFRSYPDLYSD